MAGIVRMYTDGACSGNQNENNFGGWGAVLEFGEHRKELYGGEKDTTNNRMELTAVIESFKALKRDGLTVQVFSDSSYVINCFKNKWHVNWVKNGWKTSGKKDVSNKELWQELLALVGKHNVSFFLVKGHVDLLKSQNPMKYYEQFCEHNGTGFNFEDFEYIIGMNNRADALANLGIDQVRE